MSPTGPTRPAAGDNVPVNAPPPRPRGPRKTSADTGRRRPGLPLVVIALALVLAGVGGVLLAGAYDEPRQSQALGENLAINDGATNALDLSANNSPALVQNPADPANLVVANRIDSPDYSCALHVSFDGGGRWTQTPIPAPPDVGSAKCYAPDVAFTANGALYVSFVTLKGRANAPDAVWIMRSTDGGKTLSQPVRTPLGPRSFQVRLTTDARAPRRIFLTWLKASGLGLYQFSQTGNPIMSIRSDDGGRNWTTPTRVSAPGRQRVVAPAVAPGREAGELNVLYLDLGDDALDYNGGHRGQGGAPYEGKWQLILARSTDNGGTWSESIVDQAIVPTERFVVFTPPSPSLAVDRDSGRLYASFHDGRFGDADVLLWSLPGGRGGWSDPMRVNDTRRGDRTSQYQPKLSVAPNGRLDVLYYDRRADRTDVLNEVSLQSSFDEGQSFSDRVRLSDGAFSSRIGFGVERDLPDLGSANGLISTNSLAYGLWTDTRSGSVKTAKQDLARGVVAFNDPPRLSGAAESLLRYGGILLVLMGVGLGLFALVGVPADARRPT